MTDDLATYRKHLVDARQQAQADYDKTVLTLAGGALGISFAFVERFVKDQPPFRIGFLVAAWMTWTVSLASVLVSFYLSRLSLDKAIRQADGGTIRRTRPGGVATILVEGCNFMSGASFVVGLVLMALFVWYNMRN